MSRFHVLVSDCPWPDLELERAILDQVDARLVLAPSADVATLAELLTDADALLACWARIPGEVLVGARRCRIVARLGIGLDNIDVECCTRLGIPVTNVPDYCVDEVAEHTLALLLALGRKVAWFHWETSQGRYDLQAGPPPRRLRGQTLGVIGWGRLGQAVGQRASALGLHVLACTRRPPEDTAGIRFCDLETLLAESDFVSLHLPLTEATRRLIDRSALRRMKRSAFLINTARGGLVDHGALAEALAEGRLAGAALDVQQREPPDLNEPPYNDPRVIVTPHAAFLSQESLVELRTRAASQVVARLRGEVPQNVVNPEALRDR